jgi:hypothetical protein
MSSGLVIWQKFLHKSQWLHLLKVEAFFGARVAARGELPFFDQFGGAKPHLPLYWRRELPSLSLRK